jgi:hypothetical protein
MEASPSPVLAGRFRVRKLGALGTAVCMVLPLLPLTLHDALGPCFYVLSGQMLTSQFDPIHAGSVLDQPTIGKWYILCTFFTVVTFPYLAAVRWASARTTWTGYWAFAGPTIIVCFWLLCMLTTAFSWLVQYIYAMGFTTRRVYGLAYGIGAYIVILGFLYWALRVSTPKTRATRSSVTS